MKKYIFWGFFYLILNDDDVRRESWPWYWRMMLRSPSIGINEQSTMIRTLTTNRIKINMIWSFSHSRYRWLVNMWLAYGGRDDVAAISLQKQTMRVKRNNLPTPELNRGRCYHYGWKETDYYDFCLLPGPSRWCAGRRLHCWFPFYSSQPSRFSLRIEWPWSL